MTTVVIPSLAVASVGLVLAAGALGLVGGTRVTEAQSAMEMGLDMEITGNTATTLGPIEYCYEIPWSDEPFDGVADWTIDVYVRGDTQAPLAYDAWVTYDNIRVHIVDPTDPLVKMPGAANLSDSVPDNDGQFNAGASYLSPPYDGVSGDGTLVRTGIDIGVSGLVTVGFAKGAYRSEAGLHAVTTVSAQLAINTACPGPVGGTAKLPAVPSSASQGYIGLAAGVVAALIALVAIGWYTRRWWPT